MVFLLNFELIESFQKVIVRRNALNLLKRAADLSDTYKYHIAHYMYEEPSELPCGLSEDDHKILSTSIKNMNFDRGIIITDHDLLWKRIFDETITSFLQEIGVPKCLDADGTLYFAKRDIQECLARYIIKPYFDAAAAKFLVRAWKPGGAMSVKGWEHCEKAIERSLSVNTI